VTGVASGGRALDEQALAPLATAAPLVALFDIDGTLAPIAPRPELAAVPERTRRALAALTARPGVHVGAVTGRAVADGARMLQLPGLWIVGNHGVESCDPDGARHLDPAAVAAAEPLARAAAALAGPVAAVPGALLEDKRWGLTVHTRLAPPDAVPALEATVRAVAAREGLRVGEGKQVLELRIPADVDKGTAAVALARRLGVAPGSGAVLFVGDDVTDEDGFRRLRASGLPAVTVRVAANPVATDAEWQLGSTDAVAALLERLAALRAP
jgi:trehalose 6-phosphate phosphatase